MAQRDFYADDRSAMVTFQLARRGIATPAVLDAMKAVPREAFIPEDLREFAYEDSPLPIAEEQTISQPFIVARMIELAGLDPSDTVLEVGAGSGYAAAVMGKIADKVYAIERHKALAEQARKVIEKLDYGNVRIVHGDGTNGLPGEAPFDAIIVSAGGDIPAALKDQLAVGGCLIIPLSVDGHQVLTEIRRIDEDEYETIEHDAVRFVPLVADPDKPGHVQPGHKTPTATRPGHSAPDLASVMAEAAEPFDTHDDLARMAERFADRKVVCLGESTHGTSEFYSARAAITEHLVREHGFNIVAVEADWPDAAIYDKAIREGAGERQHAAEPFARFPRWMWRNEETRAMVRRLREINRGREETYQAGFYGLDVYSLCASIEAVIEFLEGEDSDLAEAARERYGCLTPYCSEPGSYARMRIGDGFRKCEDRVVSVLTELLKERVENGEGLFDAEQNARIVKEAEKYYRIMYYGDANSWNLRDSHMADTLDRLLEHRGPDAKAIVWAHNSHIGDASQTEMGWIRGEHNIGQLVREKYGDDCALIGFSTHEGEVAAADDWDGRMRVKTVRPALEDAHEDHAFRTGIGRFLLDLGALDETQRQRLSEPKLQRAIGVIYRPETERASHYFRASLASQFDAWVWFAVTRAVEAKSASPAEGEDETWPFAV